MRLTVDSFRRSLPAPGAPRVHGELLKLGFEVSERTVLFDAEATERTIPNLEDFSK